MPFRSSLTLTWTAVLCHAAAASPVAEITYESAADGSRQLAMFFAPEEEEPVPLVVALHTWGGDYRQRAHAVIEEWCVENGWAYIHPHFRGANRRAEATGSDLVVADIRSAVDHAVKATSIDETAVFLVGTSGGGYTGLLVAARHPEVWAGVSAWAPISDLRAWFRQGRYRDDLIASCGGAPGDSDEVDEEYRKRSPITYLAQARGVNLHINAGIRDGHTGSVPISHSLLAFNEVADPADRISGDDIRALVEKAAVPPQLQQEGLEDPSYGAHQPLFRRVSGNATVTIFDGGHELVPAAAIAWMQAVAERRSAPELHPIFDGESFAGWQVPANNIWWRVADGVLQVRSGPKRRGSVLWTVREYEDFVLELEFRFGKGTVDSGVFLRNDREQIQIGISGSLKRDMTCSPYISGKGYPVEAERVARLLQQNEWNVMRIEARARHYSVWLAGELVMTYTSPSAILRGPIGLQLHGSRDMDIDFRRLRVAELE